MAGRSWHDHHQEGMPLQCRNGYGRSRCLTCGCWQIALEMPRLRKPYNSKIAAKYERLTPAIQELISQLYLHRLSTGDFRQAFGWLWGEDVPLSGPSTVRLKVQWEED
jgi:transposase-like protein